MFSALPHLSESLIRYEFYFLGTLTVPFLWTLGKDSWEKTFILFSVFFKNFHEVMSENSSHETSPVFVNALFLTLIFKYVHMVCQHCPDRLPDFFLQKNISQSSRVHLLINPFLSPKDEMPFQPVRQYGSRTDLNIKAVSFSFPEELFISHQLKPHHQRKPQLRVY